MPSRDLLFFSGLDGVTGDPLVPPCSAEDFAEQVIPNHRWAMRAKVAGGPGAPSFERMSPPALARWVVGRQSWRPLAPSGVRKALLARRDPQHLEQAGWGLIVPPGGLPKPIRKALAPLLERRSGEAGEAREIEYRSGETVRRFLVRHGTAYGEVDPEKLPYYLLIVAPPSVVPFEFQYDLNVRHAVGRLWFDGPPERAAERFASYAQGVLDSEAGKCRRQGAVVFGIQNDDDPPTDTCRHQLSEPLARAMGDFRSPPALKTFFGEEATKERMVSLLGGPDTPAVFFSASHAVCFRQGEDELLTDQGALVCADWPGREKWKGRPSPDHYFAAKDLDDSADVRGLVTFHYACFSAGTPEMDSYARARGKPEKRLSDEPLLSSLPQRLLGHPGGGALAVLGRVDLAWEHSFEWPGVGSHITHFESAFEQLLAGKRIGTAFEPFADRYAQIATAVARELLDSTPDAPKPEGLAHLWMAHHDAQSLVLLGDPAVRLP